MRPRPPTQPPCSICNHSGGSQRLTTTVSSVVIPAMRTLAWAMTPTPSRSGEMTRKSQASFIQRPRFSQSTRRSQTASGGAAISIDVSTTTGGAIWPPYQSSPGTLGRMTMRVFEQLVVGALQCNCYLVGDPVTLEAIVIDPGDDPDAILAAAEHHGLKLVAAVATHAHFDHVLAAEAIRQRTGIPFYLHADDVPVLAFNQEAARLFLGTDLPPSPDVDRTYADGDELVAGSMRLGVIHTPGHSPGSVSLVAPDEALFSGDTLFSASV